MKNPSYQGRRCFVCGPENPIGLGLVFRLDGDVCRSQFTPQENHCGWDGVTHGGILFSVLDDVMANWIYLNGMKGFTAKCDIRFRKQLPLGCCVELEGKPVKRKRNLIQLEGRAIRRDDGQLVADCQATFMVADTPGGMPE